MVHCVQRIAFYPKCCEYTALAWGNKRFSSSIWDKMCWTEPRRHVKGRYVYFDGGFVGVEEA